MIWAQSHDLRRSMTHHAANMQTKPFTHVWTLCRLMPLSQRDPLMPTARWPNTERPKPCKQSCWRMCVVCVRSLGRHLHNVGPCEKWMPHVVEEEEFWSMQKYTQSTCKHFWKKRHSQCKIVKRTNTHSGSRSLCDCLCRGS